ncbi:DMT family transporter [Solirubrobacter soli]|uniref:DMT family transporter n=1 Tax=Solirubrobacter soli TaxID=363832 RepID=UPI0003F70EF0|nr:DMT family transporter [Solirubrobacter soli]
MRAWIGGATAAALVGASFPVSEALVDYPYATGQMIRYAAGALILAALLKGRLGMPTLKEFGLLALVAAVGMAAFNLAVLAAVDHMGATNTGVIIGASPVLLALAGTTRDRRVITAAAIVVAGAALVNGADSRISAIGLAIAFAGLGCEVGFTLLAAPLLPRLGPMRVAAWAAILATLELAVLTRGHVPTPTTHEAAAIAYLAVITTALAFVLWFGAVQQLGAAKAGLLVGFMPIAAVTVDAALNGRTPSTADLAGTALVAAGIVYGAMPSVVRIHNAVHRTLARGPMT